LLVPRARSLHAVERRTREKFLEHEIFATRERTGVISVLGEVLAVWLPPRADDRNELPNAVEQDES
jgi:uncharacterized membrane protein